MSASARAAVALAGASLVASLLAACGGSSAPPAAPDAFRGPGPFIVGVTTRHLADRPVEVWYPARRGSEAGKARATYNTKDVLPAAFRSLIPADLSPDIVEDAYRDLPVDGHGPFPVVLFSHGFGGYDVAYTWLTVHLASWGYVVAAPEHLERDLLAVATGKAQDSTHHDVKDLLDSLDMLERASQTRGDLLAGAVDARKVAVAGHSAGAFAAWSVAGDPRISTFVAISGGAVPGVAPPDKPGLLIVGTTDHTVGLQPSIDAYGMLRQPKRLVEVVNAGHTVFADICPLLLAKGGLSAIVARTHLPMPPALVKLSEDGCLPADLPAARVWPIAGQFAVAELRSVFGGRPVGFAAADIQGFGPDVKVLTSG